jgi:16S rRNA (uracil1498-N3)-methyltransferase
MITPPKKLHRFFIPSIPAAETFELVEPTLVHQLVSVLRYTIEEEFVLFSEGSDDIVVSVRSISKKEITVSKTRTIPAQQHPQIHLIAIVSIIKQDLFELVVQKLTELGVKAIVPLITTRTTKQSLRHDRLVRISTEATEQSGGNTLVTIHDPLSLENCLTAFPFPSIVFDPRAKEQTLDVPKGTQVMYIGPEGGWSAEDFDLFKKYSVYSKRLGYTILRTETAAIVGVYDILHLSST